MPLTDEEKSTKDDIQAALMARDITYIRRSVDALEKKVGKDLVTQAQFAPVQKLVYGLVGLILIAVVGALLALVIQK